MGKGSRVMGQRAERAARDLIRRLWPKVRRGYGQADGAFQADLEEAPLAIEVKEWKTWPSVEAALEQCARDCAKRDDDRPQCVIHRRKNRLSKFRTPWRITFTLDEFSRFVERERLQ